MPTTRIKKKNTPNKAKWVSIIEDEHCRVDRVFLERARKTRNNLQKRPWKSAILMGNFSFGLRIGMNLMNQQSCWGFRRFYRNTVRTRGHCDDYPIQKEDQQQNQISFGRFFQVWCLFIFVEYQRSREKATVIRLRRRSHVSYMFVLQSDHIQYLYFAVLAHRARKWTIKVKRRVLSGSKKLRKSAFIYICLSCNHNLLASL